MTIMIAKKNYAVVKALIATAADYSKEVCNVIRRLHLSRLCLYAKAESYPTLNPDILL